MKMQYNTKQRQGSALSLQGNEIQYICRGGVCPAPPKTNKILIQMLDNAKQRQGSALSLRENVIQIYIIIIQMKIICIWRDKASPCLSYNSIVLIENVG